MFDDDTPYSVGYGKPPKNSQFAPGTSGNPKGRPRGSKNFSGIVLRESRQRVLVKGPRGTKSVTKVEAAVMQTANKAAQGDARAQREFYSLIQLSEAFVNSNAKPISYREMDQKVIENLQKRMQAIQPVPDPSTREDKK